MDAGDCSDLDGELEVLSLEAPTGTRDCSGLVGELEFCGVELELKSPIID